MRGIEPFQNYDIYSLMEQLPYNHDQEWCEYILKILLKNENKDVHK